MAETPSTERAPFLTAEQQDLASYTARRLGEEIEARLGPTLDAIVTGLAAMVEALDAQREGE